ncbi:hypothetical protein [Burkholderia pyrrocinia]|uniref:hypothetical protein n=1 Tax=Burkholderia pyrrocinia TaxID=60550 RepID=UPI001EE6DE4E|nr:hypothetical protein [Burkholderia pyrrocinia]
MKKNAMAILATQDSYHKDLHNDVPTILTEMAENVGFEMRRRRDFVQGNSFPGINSRSRMYRDTSRLVEPVIYFLKIEEYKTYESQRIANVSRGLLQRPSRKEDYCQLRLSAQGWAMDCAGEILLH